jgi:hypothetical protein
MSASIYRTPGSGPSTDGAWSLYEDLVDGLTDIIADLDAVATSFEETAEIMDAAGTSGESRARIAARINTIRGLLPKLRGLVEP